MKVYVNFTPEENSVGGGQTHPQTFFADLTETQMGIVQREIDSGDPMRITKIKVSETPDGEIVERGFSPTLIKLVSTNRDSW